MRACLLLCVVLALCGVTASSAADYFVNSSGRDSNPGTEALPWQTIARVNSMKFAPGDRILFAAGQSFSGKLIMTVSGTPELPITISSYGEGRATINAGTGTGISLYNVAGYQITNLRIQGSGLSTNSGSGIMFYTDLTQTVRMPYIRVDNVEVSGFSSSDRGNTYLGWGIIVASGSRGAAAGYEDVRLTNIIAHDNAAGGIATASQYEPFPPGPGLALTNVYIGQSRVYNNSGKPGYEHHIGSGILMQGVDGGVIEHNVAYNNGYLCDAVQGGPIGIWASVANNVTIQYNESYGNRTMGPYDGGGFDFDGGVTNSVMQYNYSHDNDGGGYTLVQFTGVREWSGNVVRYNISHNDGRKNSFGGINMWGSGSGLVNAQIYHNTIIVDSAPSGTSAAVRLMSGTTGTVMRNNLFLSRGNSRVLDIAPGQKNLVMQGNNYWSYSGPVSILWQGTAYANFFTWQAATGQEKAGDLPTGFNVDPDISGIGPAKALNDTALLASMTAYRLNPGSPVVDKGVDLQALGIDTGGRDFFGTKLPLGHGPEIGAHERSADSVAPFSHMEPITFTPGAATMTLSWSGSDVMSDIADYTIYVSENGGPFVPWLTNTTQLEAPFSGTPGSTYRFFSVARDTAGNTEGLKTTGEVSISILTGSTICP